MRRPSQVRRVTDLLVSSERVDAMMFFFTDLMCKQGGNVGTFLSATIDLTTTTFSCLLLIIYRKRERDATKQGLSWLEDYL